MKLLVGILTIFLVFTSCINQENQTYESKIDSLLNVVQTTQNKLLNLKLDSIVSALKDVDSNLKFFKKNINKTDLDSTFLKDFGKYSRLEKQLKSLNKNLKKMIREVEYSKSQLDKLKKDIKNKVLEQEKFKEYFKTEKNAVDNLTKKLNPVLKNTKKDLVHYKKLQQKIDSIKHFLKKE